MSETSLSATYPATDVRSASATPEAPNSAQPSRALLRVLAAISFCHLLNDMVQSLIPTIYPILKSSFHLDFTHL